MSTVMATDQPPFSSLTRRSASMWASVKNTSLKWCSPFIWCSGRTSMPGWSTSMMKKLRPWCLGTSRLVRASSRPRSEVMAPEVQTFWPSTCHSSPSRRARVWALARSEPDPGSEKNWHHISSPRTSAGRNRCFCSCVPCSSSIGPARFWPIPVGGGRAPVSGKADRTPDASSADMPLPNHSSGQVGKPHPESASRAHHSRTVSDGSQLALSQLRACSLAASYASDWPSDAGIPAAFPQRHNAPSLERDSNIGIGFLLEQTAGGPALSRSRPSRTAAAGHRPGPAGPGKRCAGAGNIGGEMAVSSGAGAQRGAGAGQTGRQEHGGRDHQVPQLRAP